MSLTETSVLAVTRNQYHYKTKVNAGIYFMLIAVQLLALLLSLNSSGTSGSGGQNLFYTVRQFSGHNIVFFTLVWAFSIGINTARNGLKTDFTFVSNRLSSHLSSMAFLLTAAAIGGATATLCSLMWRVVMFFKLGGVEAGSGFWIAPLDLLSGIFAATLYTALFGSIGYFVGMLTHRPLVLAVLVFGLLLAQSQAQALITAVEFFSAERSHLLLALKVVLASAIILGCAILFSNRLEVRI